MGIALWPWFLTRLAREDLSTVNRWHLVPFLSLTATRSRVASGKWQVLTPASAGRKLIPGLEEARTQDFLASLSPSLPFRSPAAFVGLIRATAGPKYLALPRLIGALGLFGFLPTLRALQAGLSRPLPSLAEATFYSPLPIQWGEAAVKFAFFPGDSTAPSALARGDDPERLGTDLRARLAEGALSWELRIQCWVDEARTPIEDATVLWDPLVTPWVTVARLELPRQDLGAPEALVRAARIEQLSFDAWHAPVAFRPLGAFMRARAAAYRESVAERGVDAEPTGEEGWLRG